MYQMTNNLTHVDRFEDEFKVKVSTWKRWKANLGLTVFLGNHHRVGWNGCLPFYLWMCPKHGLTVDYPSQYDELFCPICLKEKQHIQKNIPKYSTPRRFTVVSPMHNEAENIAIWMESLDKLLPDEVIIILDRCTDETETKIKTIYESTKPDYELRLIPYNKPSTYTMRAAHLRRLAYKEARNDIILNTGADLIHDPKIREHIQKIDKDTRLIKFGYLDYPYNLQSFLRQLYSKYTPWKSHSGLMAFSRKAWLETENQQTVKTIHSSEDTHLIRAIETRYHSRYYPTKTLHLRPTETPGRDYQRGINYQDQLKIHPIRALLTSIMMLRPQFFLGYIHRRRLQK